jgi:hypothetical protein
MNSSKASDCSLIIKSFQKHLLSTPNEESIIATTLPKLASINSNAVAASSSLTNLINPPIPQEVLGAFNKDVTLTGSLTLPGLDTGITSKSVDLKNWQEWLKSCISCDLRVDFRAELSSKLDDKLLDNLELMAAAFLKQISLVINLLNSKDIYIDVCPLLFAMKDICIPDLQRILSLLASILYRMTVREVAQTDLIKLLVMPIFQPIFSGLIGILSQYKLLITDPLNCVNANLAVQLDKLRTTGTINSKLVDHIVDTTGALTNADMTNRGELRSLLNSARQPFATIDSGIDSIENSLGTATFHLQRLMTVGTIEVESLLLDLTTELTSFLGTSDKESVEFLLNQYQKLIIFRLITFISSFIKATSVGFDCNFSSPTQSQDTIQQFLAEFLGPNSPVLIKTNSITGDIELLIEKTTPSTFSPTGNVVVDTTIDAIITQSSQPVTIKARCVFDSGLTETNKLEEWLTELDGVK